MIKTARPYQSDTLAEFAALGTQEEYEAVLARMMKEIEQHENMESVSDMMARFLSVIEKTESMENEPKHADKGIQYEKMPKVGERYAHKNLLDKKIWTVRHITGLTPGFPVAPSDQMVTLERKGRSVPGGVESLVLPVAVFLEDFDKLID